MVACQKVLGVNLCMQGCQNSRLTQEADSTDLLSLVPFSKNHEDDTWFVWKLQNLQILL